MLLTKMQNFSAGLPLEETQDTLGDILKTVAVFEKTLKDGLQVSDIFAIAAQEADIRDIINSFDKVLEEIKEIDAENASKAIAGAVQRVENESGKLGKVTSFVVNLLLSAVSSYALATKVVKFGEQLIRDGKSEIENWKILFTNQTPAPLP